MRTYELLKDLYFGLEAFPVFDLLASNSFDSAFLPSLTVSSNSNVSVRAFSNRLEERILRRLVGC
jgi:hypothetical protein